MEDGFITDLYDWNMILLLHAHIMVFNILFGLFVNFYCFVIIYYIALCLKPFQEKDQEICSLEFVYLLIMKLLTFSLSYISSTLMVDSHFSLDASFAYYYFSSHYCLDYETYVDCAWILFFIKLPSLPCSG